MGAAILVSRGSLPVNGINLKYSPITQQGTADGINWTWDSQISPKKARAIIAILSDSYYSCTVTISGGVNTTNFTTLTTINNSNYSGKVVEVSYSNYRYLKFSASWPGSYGGVQTIQIVVAY